MLYQDFIECLTSGSWELRGHTYRFLKPAYNAGYFTVDGISDTQLSFEVTYENGQLYLYLNVEREAVPEERYKILSNYCNDKINMIHEISVDDASGEFEDPSEVSFIKSVEPAVAPSPVHQWAYNLGSKIHSVIRKAELIFGATANPKTSDKIVKTTV